MRGRVGLEHSGESVLHSDESGRRSFPQVLLQSSLLLDMTGNGGLMRVLIFLSLPLPVCWHSEEVL